MSFQFNIKKFLSEQNGSLTIWNTVSMVSLLTIGGFAVDTSNAWRVKTMLQNTAEASALAAAIHIEDPDKAKSTAVSFARRNMPPQQHGDVVRLSDVELGVYESETGTFIPTEVNPDSVRVTAGRDKSRSNEVSTYLLRIAGIRDWDVGRSAIAFPRWGAATNGKCPGPKVLASGVLNAGGNNTIVDYSCFHGELGVMSDGGDYFDETVTLSTRDLAELVLGQLRAGSAPVSSFAAEQSKELTILPTLDDRFAEIRAEFWNSGINEYSGSLIPDFLKNANGEVKVVRINEENWSIGGNDLAENTVYVVNGSAEFTEPTVAENVAIFAKGSITSKSTSSFQNVLFFAYGAVDFGGPTKWGNKENYCDSGEFNSYLLSEEYVALGGAGGGLFGSMMSETVGLFEGNSSAHGLVASAPIIIPGGAFLDVGSVYVESSAPYATLGGDMNVTNACETELSSHYETTKLGGGNANIVGSSLRRQKAQEPSPQ